MNRSDWSHWSVQERCVGELIVQMFEEKDPSGKKGFCPANIYDGYYEQLKALWVPKPSLSTQRRRKVIEIFEIFWCRGELFQPVELTNTYFLDENGWLFQELSTRVQESNRK